jgi:hypothetical protein
MNMAMAKTTARLGLVDLLHLGEDLVELEAAEGPEHQEQGDQQAGVADAVDDNGLLAGDGVAHAVFALIEPEADQQVGAQTDPFPAHEQHQEVVGRHQHHHGGDEQVEVNEKARVAARVAVMAHVLVHIADGVDMDQGAHPAHHQHHGHREGIHPEGPRHAELTDRDPVGEGHPPPSGCWIRANISSRLPQRTDRRPGWPARPTAGSLIRRRRRY